MLPLSPLSPLLFASCMPTTNNQPTQSTWKTWNRQPTTNSQQPATSLVLNASNIKTITQQDKYTGGNHVKAINSWNLRQLIVKFETKKALVDCWKIEIFPLVHENQENLRNTPYANDEQFEQPTWPHNNRTTTTQQSHNHTHGKDSRNLQPTLCMPKENNQLRDYQQPTIRVQPKQNNIKTTRQHSQHWLYHVKMVDSLNFAVLTVNKLDIVDNTDKCSFVKGTEIWHCINCTMSNQFFQPSSFLLVTANNNMSKYKSLCSFQTEANKRLSFKNNLWLITDILKTLILTMCQ